MSTCYHCQAEIVPGNSFCVECGNAAPPVPMPMPVNSDNDGEGASFLAKNAGRVACILVLIGFVLLPWSTSGSNTEKGLNSPVISEAPSCGSSRSAHWPH